MSPKGSIGVLDKKCSSVFAGEGRQQLDLPVISELGSRFWFGESTIRYLGVDIEDALALSDQTEIWRIVSGRWIPGRRLRGNDGLRVPPHQASELSGEITQFRRF